MSENLSKYILATIAYYDVMDYPMTAFEVWKYMMSLSGPGAEEKSDLSQEEKRFSLADVVSALENEEKLKKFVASQDGYYFLSDRTGLVEKRLQRNKISEKKIRKILRAAKMLRFVPYVRMAAVAGRLACKNAEKGSDLDLLIGLKHGKIFTGRFLVTALVHLSGQRRHADKIQDRICLNHFVTTKFSISAQDIFSSHEYAFLKPVFDNDFFLLFQKNNGWVQKYRPNFVPAADNISSIKDSSFSKNVRRLGERLLSPSFIEKKLGKWQKDKIAKNPKTRKIGGLILCGDEELAFWPNFEKQGPAVFEKFQERLKGMTERKK
jgi:hypothetical protein